RGIEVKVMARDHKNFVTIELEQLSGALIGFRQRLIHLQHFTGNHRIPLQPIVSSRVYDQRYAEDCERNDDIATTQTFERDRKVGPSIQRMPVSCNCSSLALGESG